MNGFYNRGPSEVRCEMSSESVSRMMDVPCLIGETLWCLVGSDCSVVLEMRVDNLFINKIGVVIGLSGYGKYQEIFGEDIGRIAFWSEEEAVAARDDCLKVVRSLLAQAVAKTEKLGQNDSGILLDALDDRGSGLVE